MNSKNSTDTAINSISIVIPVYNSEKTIGRLVDTVINELSPCFKDVEVILVNDGSHDSSHLKALEIVERHSDNVKYINLSRNFGEHNAVMCGLRFVTGDCAAIIDDDFQTPPSEINGMVDRLREGYDVVYSYYEKKQHHWLRNLGSRFNDRISTWLLKKPSGLYLSSFKVMTRFLAETITKYNGPYPYIDGLILRSTHSIGTQLCRHNPRTEGRSNYNLRRLFLLWLNMVTSFSVTPLRLSAVLGFLMSLVGFLLAIFFVVSWSVGGIFASNEFPRGWASLIVTITIFSGIQLVVLGMVGEYVGRLFLTENEHPQFVIRETYGKNDAGDPAA